MNLLVSIKRNRMTIRSSFGCFLLLSLVLGQCASGQEAVVSPQPAASENLSVEPLPAPTEAPAKAEAEVANPIQLDAKPINNHQQVVIAPEVQLAKDMYFRGGGQAVGSMFGIIGALVTTGTEQGPKEQMLAIMGKEQILVSAIVLAEADSKIGGVRAPESLVSASHPAILKISVPMYGFDRSQLFSSKMYPTIKVTMVLTSETGALIWKESEWVSSHALENDQGFSFDVYMKDPGKIRSTLTKISQIAVRRLFASLERQLAKQPS